LQRCEPICCNIDDRQRVGFLFVCHGAFYTESPSWVNEGQDDEAGLRGAWLGSPKYHLKYDPTPQTHADYS
jgi:hypothetical protein